MELPKNITQIGEIDHNCRIYVEDYVISYIKQVNVHARDKTMAVAVYGERKEEAGVSYLFFYGACRLNFLTRESRHLSQAVQQEVEELRQRYFLQYRFLGYCMLSGEMVEGFHVCQQGVCRYIAGYAQFYEKNDTMLAFMLEDRKEKAKPEEIDQEKYDEVKKRQEERKLQSDSMISHVRSRKPDAKDGARNLRNMKYAAAVLFLVLCVAGMTTLNGGDGLNDLQVMTRQILESVSAKQLPDEGDGKNKSVLVVTEDLEDEIYKEGMAGTAAQGVQAAGSSGVAISTGEHDASPEELEVPDSPDPIVELPVSETPNPEPVTDSGPEPTAEPVSYIVQKNDTLISICIRIYGSADMVKEVCDFNNIINADDIKVGQKILLP